MKKKYLILNYIMFSVFFIMIVLNNYLLKPNINLTKKNTPKALDIKLIINPLKNIEMNFDDFLEITKNTNNKVKLIKIKKNNLEIIPLKNKLEQKTKFQKVLKKDLKLDAFNNHKIIPLVIKKKEFLDIQTKNNAEIYKNISKGKLLLKHNKKFDISFKWPVNNNSHDLIYEKLSKCLNVKTVILSEKGVFYSLEGIINKHLFNNKFSPILRAPNNTYVNIETENVKNIEKKYNLPIGGKLIRIFDIYTDSFILGRFEEEAIKRSLKLNKFSGVYTIIKNGLYLTDLQINNVKIKNNINLSLLKKNC
jgi:hypothetical protein